jgi:hypothetical protein
MIAYNTSKLLSSMVVTPSPLVNNIEFGVNATFIFGKSKVQTCYTANFLSAPSFSVIIVINI